MTQPSGSPVGVSVVIPAFNHPGTLPRAVESVLAQAGVKIEIIVVDDHSADPVVRADLPSGDIRIVRTSTNVGAGPARNLGAKTAAYGVLAFLDADDEWLPGSLKQRLDHCAPGTLVFGPYLEQKDASGATRRVGLRENEPLQLHIENPIAPSTLVMTFDDFWQLEGFPVDRHCAEDWVLWLRALHAGLEFVAVADPVGIIHRDLHNTTRDPRASIEHALGAVRIMHEERLGTPEQLAQARRIVNARAAAWSANAGQLRASFRYARAASRDGLDRRLLRQLAEIPVQGARGSARRTRDRWRARANR